MCHICLSKTSDQPYSLFLIAEGCNCSMFERSGTIIVEFSAFRISDRSSGGNSPLDKLPNISESTRISLCTIS